MNTVVTVLGLIARHWDIVELIIDLVENRGVEKSRIIQALKDGLGEASDLEMHKKFPNG